MSSKRFKKLSENLKSQESEVIEKLLQDLNATVTSAGEVEVAVLELEEQWSYV